MASSENWEAQMAKLNSAPITSSDLLEYLKARDDFALELRVFNAARRVGMSGAHGGPYIDATTERTRQFDVRVTATHEERLHVHLAIECKSLQKNCPLLVSRVPRTSLEAQRDLMSVGNLGGALEIPSIREHHCKIYPPGQPVGKSTAQVGRTADGWSSTDHEIYDKWLQAYASVASWATDVASSRPPGRHAFLPVLVVSDGTLWVADFDDDGALVSGPTKADEATLYLGRRVPGRPACGFMVSHLHVCTESGVLRLIQEAANDGPWLDRLFADSRAITE
jgi:hypothetical protein